MLRLIASIVVLSVFALGKTAQADTIGVFSLNAIVLASNNETPEYAVSGTVYLDQTLGYYSGADFTAAPLFQGSTFTFTNAPAYQKLISSPHPDEVSADFGANETVDGLVVILQLSVPGKTLIGYTGGDICSLQNSLCDLDYNGYPSDLYGSEGPAEVVEVLQGSLKQTGTILEAYPLPYDPTQGTDPTQGVNSPPDAPEPSSLILLGTGLLGTLDAVRRRIRTSQ